MFPFQPPLGAMAGHLSIPIDTIVPSISTDIRKEVGQHDAEKQSGRDDQENPMQRKTPTPIYRHSAPSGPWPWMDFDEDFVDLLPPDQPTGPETQPWRGYPRSSFPNWTDAQVKRCKMLTDCPVGESNVSKVDVLHDGTFHEDDLKMATIKDSQTEVEFWDLLQHPRAKNVRVRSLFVKKMTKEVMQMLGTKYDIEPFFFSSSTNWIPSRYQESLVQKKSDHITIVLPFIRVVDRLAVSSTLLHLPQKETGPSPSSQQDGQMIDTQSPLYLYSCDKYILQDLLSVHMVRAAQTSTIISYHPDIRSTTADQLHSLINRTGRSVYWSKIFKRSKDPTCLFLCFLWYAMYEWDEVFEILYAHINSLEQLILNSDNIKETRSLHVLQAHLLYHRTLLEDFKNSVLFVQTTANPAMQDPAVNDRERAESETILDKETNFLISEIERLESQRMMQVMRLKNVMDLAFASVNIDDSRYMKELTLATVRDSAAMKQISYLTMIFLPANFMSNVFSMNVKEINPQGGETLAHYIEGAVGLTVFASWLAIALQVESSFFPRGSTFWKRVGWPMFYIWDRCCWMYYQRFNSKQKTM